MVRKESYLISVSGKFCCLQSKLPISCNGTNINNFLIIWTFTSLPWSTTSFIVYQLFGPQCLYLCFAWTTFSKKTFSKGISFMFMLPCFNYSILPLLWICWKIILERNSPWASFLTSCLLSNFGSVVLFLDTQ